MDRYYSESVSVAGSVFEEEPLLHQRVPHFPLTFYVTLHSYTC